MEYSHSPCFRTLAPSPDTTATETFGEQFRESLFSASICLALFSRLRAGAEGAADDLYPWSRLADFLDEVNADLRESIPYDDRMMGWVTVLSMVAEAVDLQKIDPDYHFLLSLFVQACLLIELGQTLKLSSGEDSKNREATRTRIQASLDFVVEELAERRRRERRATPRTVAAA